MDVAKLVHPLSASVWRCTALDALYSIAPRRCTDTLEPYRGPQGRAGFRYSGVIRPLLQRVNTPEHPSSPARPTPDKEAKSKGRQLEDKRFASPRPASMSMAWAMGS